MSNFGIHSAATASVVAAAFSALLLHTPADAAATDFAGSTACAECHAAQWQAWRGSHHERAMAEATAETVLGDFNNVEFSAQGLTSLFYRRNGGFFVRTDGADGKLQDFRIRYTFGWYPLQQYMIEFPRGHMQVLGIAWDSRPATDGGQRWFHLYPDEAINHRHPLHWTARDQTWNYQCAECHSTNLRKNYQSATDSYATTWAEISVGCEACHGPGAAHVRRAREAQPEAAGDAVYGMPVAMETCARCHSRRGQINAHYEHGRPLGDSHRLALLDDGLYFPDGQVRDEVYVYGSFIQSKMHAAGVTCSDCHDPHSLRLHKTGNDLCTGCHLAADYDAPSHHHHTPGTPGAACKSCHMPERLYMVIDARADHSIRVPRPDLSVKLGTPNACNACHAGRSSEWASEVVAGWYPGSRHRGAHFAETFGSAAAGEAGAADRLAAIALDSKLPGIVRATAVARLRPTASTRHFDRLPELVTDGDPLVRTAAVRLLERAELHTQVELGWPLLQDPQRVVRIEAARALAPLLRQSLPEPVYIVLRDAVDDYVQAEQVNAERPEAQLNLGNLFVSIGDAERAEAAYLAAMALDETFTPAYVNLADLYRAEQREEDAERVLRIGLAAGAPDAALSHALGLLLARGQRIAEGLPYLRSAAEIEPGQPRHTYVYALALQAAGDTRGALTVLERGWTRHQGDREILLALITLHRDSGDLPAARRYAEALGSRYPGDPVVDSLRRELGAGSQ